MQTVVPGAVIATARSAGSQLKGRVKKWLKLLKTLRGIRERAREAFKFQSKFICRRRHKTFPSPGRPAHLACWGCGTTTRFKNVAVSGCTCAARHTSRKGPDYFADRGVRRSGFRHLPCIKYSTLFYIRIYCVSRLHTPGCPGSEAFAAGVAKISGTFRVVYQGCR